MDNPEFPTTHWSLILSAGNRESHEARTALQGLCQDYWYPVYAFIRRKGHRVDRAEDLTQAFFTRLVEKNPLENVKPIEGKRFRSFLRVAVRNFVANEWHRDRPKNCPAFISIHAAESQFAAESARERRMDPEAAFERDWATTLLRRVLDSVRQQYADHNDVELFEKLKAYLTFDQRLLPHAKVAESLGKTPKAVKIAVYRLRQTFKATLCREIAATVENIDEIEEEISSLHAALSK